MERNNLKKKLKEVYSYHFITGLAATKTMMNSERWIIHPALKHENRMINKGQLTVKQITS